MLPSSALRCGPGLLAPGCASGRDLPLLWPARLALALALLLRQAALGEALQRPVVDWQVEERATVRSTPLNSDLVVTKLVQQAPQLRNIGGNHPVSGQGQQPALGEACAAACFKLVLCHGLNQLPMAVRQAPQHEADAGLPRPVPGGARVAPGGQAASVAKRRLRLVALPRVHLFTAEVKVSEAARVPTEWRPDAVHGCRQMHTWRGNEARQGLLVWDGKHLKVVHHQAERPHWDWRSLPCRTHRGGKGLHRIVAPLRVRVELLQDIAQALRE
mmetsp:Transcript_144521/g.402671  ORF Transcript_144521/g.402671 Transcript_144521/m.402671 type:complete len:273 (+) Transcript_144521:177-995(+)